ncbi:hypothetical protein [Mesorhizobium sp. B2-3-4]|uniref:hypothetical protein n=1 Tax=Mesorhizobium sp. B2-3-4 TaxID=2589959 RepID=UPI001129FC99|nr:hypothetical protein [Mesorhizobium sp. B2-3-4]TPM40675.1 hypothetical protein FJ967_04885 [Mesorhizobium sp. B2-3-4]
MDSRKREQPAVQADDPTRTERPTMEQQDWEELEGAKILPDSGSLEGEPGQEGNLPEEDDDNAYQDSDEALPDDIEEAAISRDPSREGSRFDED